jgi:HSP90 family molecular chaperone
VGHTLYNDSSVVVRELVQNAIDAVKLQKRYEHKKRNQVILELYKLTGIKKKEN